MYIIAADRLSRIAADQTTLARPQNEPADRISIASTGNGIALLFECRRTLLIRRQKDGEGSSILDLLHEISGRSGADFKAVAAALRKISGELLHRLRKISRDRRQHFFSAGRTASRY